MLDTASVHVVPTSDVIMLFTLSFFDNLRKVKNKSKSILKSLMHFLPSSVSQFKTSSLWFVNTMPLSKMFTFASQNFLPLPRGTS